MIARVLNYSISYEQEPDFGGYLGQVFYREGPGEFRVRMEVACDAEAMRRLSDFLRTDLGLRSIPEPPSTGGDGFTPNQPPRIGTGMKKLPR